MHIYVFCVDVPDSFSPNGFKSVRITIPAASMDSAKSFFEEHFSSYFSWWAVYMY